MSKLFEALADPIRRELIARLHGSEPQSLSALADGLPISRQAVTKHLNLLERAGLVLVERKGRLRLHALDARPLAEIDAWLEPYSVAWDRRLARLALHVDGEARAAKSLDAEVSKHDNKETEQ